MKNNNKGITLTALVITIIIMMILVAVSVTVAVNGGLFGNAGIAAKKTDKAKDLEQEYANVTEEMTTQDLIDKYKEKDQETPGDDENIQITISGSSEVDVKNTITLAAESENASFDASKIEWTSSNPQVATIENGVVTGVDASINEGKVTIIAKYNNKEFEKEIIVKPVLVDCLICTDPDFVLAYYCDDCIMDRWNELTNNAEIIIAKNCDEIYSDLMYSGDDVTILPVFTIYDVNGHNITRKNGNYCIVCEGASKLYDMGGCYKRVEQEPSI